MQQRLHAAAQARLLPGLHRLGCGACPAPILAFRVGAQRVDSSSPRLARRGTALVTTARQSSQEAGSGASGGVGLFPAGKRQARVQLPALMLAVTAADVLDPAQAGGALEALSAAVAGGATAVVLAQGADGGGSGGAELYEAAVRLKELLRGRAVLLIADRTDIVDAAGADGALLTGAGLPTMVAKRMLQDGLALVGRAVSSAEAAAEAAADGANFVILEPSGPGLAAPNSAEAVASQQQQRSSASIPVVAAVSGEAGRDQLAQLLAAGVDGLVVQLGDLQPVAAALARRQPAGAGEAAAAVMQQLAGGVAPPAASLPADAAAAAAGPPQAVQQAVQLSQLLSTSREELVDAERQLFTEASPAAAVARPLPLLRHGCCGAWRPPCALLPRYSALRLAAPLPCAPHSHAHTQPTTPSQPSWRAGAGLLGALVSSDGGGAAAAGRRQAAGRALPAGGAGRVQQR